MAVPSGARKGASTDTAVRVVVWVSPPVATGAAGAAGASGGRGGRCGAGGAGGKPIPTEGGVGAADGTIVGGAIIGLKKNHQIAKPVAMTIKTNPDLNN